MGIELRTAPGPRTVARHRLYTLLTLARYRMTLSPKVEGAQTG